MLLKTPLARHRAAAFTLIEVMMASVILVIGFIGLIEAVGLSSNMMDNARRQSLATQIVSHEMEKLRLDSWTQIQALTTTSLTAYSDAQFNTAIAASGANYSLTRTVADITSDANGNVVMRQVTLTVSWAVTTSRLDASNHRLTFTYTRTSVGFFGKNGLNLAYQRS